MVRARHALCVRRSIENILNHKHHYYSVRTRDGLFMAPTMDSISDLN